MEIFSLTSKKASVTLVFLIVSVLVISSGVVIVHEIKKTNNERVGTGLVLLDNVQHVEEQEVDNVNSFVIYDKDSSEDSSKSKKSEKTSKDDLELLSFNSEDEGLEEDFTNVSDQIFSRNGIDYILRDDKEYILSSSDAKSSEISFNPALPSSVCVGASGNEKIDIGIQGGFYASANLDGGIYCTFNPNSYVLGSLKLKIMEYDFWSSDDLIAEKTFEIQVYCDNSKVDYSHVFENVDLSLQFTGIGAIEVYGLVELTGNYLKDSAYSTYPNSKVKKETTCECISGSCCDLSIRPYEYAPYGSQPTDHEDYYTCDGTSSPTGTSYVEFIDWYCSGSYNEAYLDKTYKDTCGTCAYCEVGYSSCFFYYQDEYCGTEDCDYLDTTCRNYYDVDRGCSGGGVCSNPSCDSYTNADPGTSCGTNKECDGSGNCVSADIACSSDSDCGTDEWVGSDFCSSDDVYQDYRTWVCNDAGTTSSTCSYVDTATLKQDCGTAGCSDGVCNEVSCPSSVCGGYCGDYSDYPTVRFYNSGSSYYFYCSDKTCGYSDYEYCSQGCENGQCKEAITCSLNSDCGTDEWVGSDFCSGDDIYQDYRTWTCNDAGTTSSTCSYVDTATLKQDCGTAGCSDGVCNTDCHGTYNPGDYNYCSSSCKCDAGEGDCDNNDECAAGLICELNVGANYGWPSDVDVCELPQITCSLNSDCGANVWTGSAFCSSGDVYQGYSTYTCSYPGTSSSYCSDSDTDEKKEECGTSGYSGTNYCYNNDVYRAYITRGCSDSSCTSSTSGVKQEECSSGYCSSWGADYCKGEDVYHKRTCYYGGCSNDVCYNNLITDEQKVQDCENGCTEGRCLIEVCEEVCSFTNCYEYCGWL